MKNPFAKQDASRVDGAQRSRNPAHAVEGPNDDGMRSASRLERAEALARRRAMLRRTHDTKLAELQATIGKERAALAEEEIRADEIVVATYTARAASLVADLRETLWPIAPQWLDQPTRELSRNFGHACERFNERAERELRPPTGASTWTLSTELVVCAFGDALLREYPAAVNAFGAPDWTLGPRFSVLLTLPDATRVGGPQLYAKLEDIEGVLRAVAAKSSSAALPDSIRRYEIKRSSVTAHDLTVAMEALEQVLRAEQRAHMERTYKPPPGAWIST